MARNNTVKVSDEELEKLKRLRDEYFSQSTPLGEVIGSVNDNSNQRKKILITGVGTNRQFGYQNNRLSGSDFEVIAKPIGRRSGVENLRGLNPDVVILITEIPDPIMSDVIEPMSSGNIIHLGDRKI